VRVHPLTTGVVRLKAGSRGVRRYLVDEWRDETLPVHVFLVEHPDGLLLFDTGQTSRATSPDWFPTWHPFFRLSRFELSAEDEVAPQLRGLGFGPTDVRWVVLSHLHTDHIGGVGDFAASDVLVPRLEWELAAGRLGQIRGYLPQHWPTDVTPTLVDFRGPPLGPFAATYDVAGDGTMILVPTPGHTRGHAALLVRNDTETRLLAGDMAHTASEVATTSPAVAAWCRAEGVAILTAHDHRPAGIVGETT